MVVYFCIVIFTERVGSAGEPAGIASGPPTESAGTVTKVLTRVMWAKRVLQVKNGTKSFRSLLTTL